MRQEQKIIFQQWIRGCDTEIFRWNTFSVYNHSYDNDWTEEQHHGRETTKNKRPVHISLICRNHIGIIVTSGEADLTMQQLSRKEPKILRSTTFDGYSQMDTF